MSKPPGTLYICPTPIGNLEDITLRVLRILKEVDLIAAENTTHTKKLLNHFEISKPLISYYDSGDPSLKEEKLIEQLKNGLTVALVSSAGTPLISDPGYGLIQQCIREKIPTVSLPGPSAVITALAASGLPPHPFFFGGFIPAKSKARQDFLTGMIALPATLVFYEAPHRILESLEDCLRILGDRPAALARELTKIHEEILHGALSEILTMMAQKPPKGEITLLIGPPGEPPTPEWEALEKEIQVLLKKGVSISNASRELAKKYGLSKNKIYAMAHRAFAV